MNLSERLDEARRKRERGEVSDEARSPFDLRMTIDDRVYDGTDLRDGSELTAEQWNERRSDEKPVLGLPPWKPTRANRDVEPSWEPERSSPAAEADPPHDPAPAPPAKVVPMRTGRSTDSGFGLPAWAEGAKVYTPLVQGPTPPRGEDPAVVSSCTNCGGAGRVEHLDLLADTARLECDTCGFRWIEAASAHSRTR